jgi:UDP-GlcNAc:undecaprenyl-phosphate/decaprenyl-phosphate GlcNAc-1-phosphate transferase
MCASGRSLLFNGGHFQTAAETRSVLSRSIIMLLYFAACLAPAFLISFVATAAMRRLAPRWGLVDQPAARKMHTSPTPLGGGIGIWLGIVVPLALTQVVALLLSHTSKLSGWFPAEFKFLLDGIVHRSGQMWAIIAGGTILAVMGLIDDLCDLPWLRRLLVQLAVAVALTLAGVRATLFVSIPWLGGAVTVLWILVLVNAFNFLDNMDGLSAGIGLIAAAMFAVVMLRMTSEPRWLVGGVLMVMVGSLAGFLCHNRAPARIFMGDSGSYFVGLLIASMTVLGTFYEKSASVTGPHVMLAPLCILAIPLYDFCSVMLIRLRQGRSPFHADKSHFSHRLVELGLRPSHAVLTIYLATLTTGLGALLLYEVKGWAGAWLVVALIGCVLAVVAILETVGRGSNGDS